MSQENVDRYALAARVHGLLAPELAAEGWDLLDVRIFRGGGRLQLRLYVDLPGEDRIDLDGCAAASRAASMYLEEADIFPGAWVLEVSSPGIRRPLRTADHFAAQVGAEVAVTWRQRGVKRNLRGHIRQVDGGVVTIQPLPSQDATADAALEPVQVPVADVLEANLEHDFDVQAVIREDRRQRKEEKRERRAQRRTKRSRPKSKGPARAQGDEQNAAAGDADPGGPDTDEKDG